MRIASVAILAFALLFAGCARDEAPPAGAAQAIDLPTDPLSGLKMAKNWELVRAACTTCHSAKQITQQRGTADQWLTMIRWMQKKQNLWAFDTITEERIIVYLAENYPPKAAQRRAALAPDLMPPNPYRPAP
jgi:PBP1b-binding outer membrane lipoprotein LpoB